MLHLIKSEEAAINDSSLFAFISTCISSLSSITDSHKRDRV